MIETIRSSYGIRFETTLNSICLSKSRSALEYINFVSSAVCDLLKFGLISEVLTPSSVVNLSLVSVHLEEKPSLVLYLRHVNGCISKAKFRNKLRLEGFSPMLLAGWLHVQIRFEIEVPPH